MYILTCAYKNIRAKYKNIKNIKNPARVRFVSPCAKININCNEKNNLNDKIVNGKYQWTEVSTNKSFT